MVEETGFVHISEIDVIPKLLMRSKFDPNLNSCDNELFHDVLKRGVQHGIELKRIKANRYVLLAGYRSLMAAKMAGLVIVPYVIVHYSEEEYKFVKELVTCLANNPIAVIQFLQKLYE